MQKKIITLAIASLSSTAAFADTTVYGVLDAAIASISADGQKSDMQVLSGGLSSSRVGVKASEDLDGSLKGIAVLEYGLDTVTSQGTTVAVGNPTTGTTTATNIVARQQLLGLASEYGTVAAGYLQTAGYDWGGKYDVVAGSVISPLQNITASKSSAFLIGVKAGASRLQRAVAYLSPGWAGFSFAANYSTDINAANTLGNAGLATTAADAKTSATMLSVSYDNAPLSVGVVYAGTSNFVGVKDATEYALGAAYDFGFVKFKATYQATQDSQVATKASPLLGSINSIYSLGALASVGTGDVIASYAASTIGTTANSNASGYTLGYLQPLSKSTKIYAAYSSMSQETATQAYSVDNSVLGNTSLTKGGNSSLVAIGLNRKF